METELHNKDYTIQVTQFELHRRIKRMNYKDMTPEQKAEDNKLFTYQIEKRIAVLSRYGNTTKELNLISYRGKPAKYDIRSWEYKGTERTLGKGVTLDEAELMELKKALFNGV